MGQLKKVKLGNHLGEGYAEITSSGKTRKSCNGIIYFDKDPGEIVGENTYSGVVYNQGNEHQLEFEVVVHKKEVSNDKIVAHFTANENPFSE